MVVVKEHPEQSVWVLFQPHPHRLGFPVAVQGFTCDFSYLHPPTGLGGSATSATNTIDPQTNVVCHWAVRSQSEIAAGYAVVLLVGKSI